jgi:hypothetical protein
MARPNSNASRAASYVAAAPPGSLGTPTRGLTAAASYWRERGRLGRMPEEIDHDLSGDDHVVRSSD